MTSPRHATTVVVGGGHSGLAASRHLAARGIDHVVLERGRVAHSWRTQRFDSLRLLTPNWMTRLPGYAYDGEDPDGFLSASQVADLLQAYAAAGDAPVHGDTTVERIRPTDGGFQIETSQGPWTSRSVVVASGAVRGVAPAIAQGWPIPSIHALSYRNPDQLPPAGVLVVGGGASGVQIAAEVQASGRQVTLSTGEHVRAPRSYRGRDLFAWIDEIGLLDEQPSPEDLARARRLPSFQLGAGRAHDLNSLQDAGVRIVGRLAEVRGEELLFSGSLPNAAALADLKLRRLLQSIDAYAGGRGELPEPTRVPAPVLSLSLARGEIGSVVWATGIKADHSFLEAPVFDAKGSVRHDGGRTPVAGLYVTGLPVLRRRRSTYIDGADGDTAAIVAHLGSHLGAAAAGGEATPAPEPVLR